VAGGVFILLGKFYFDSAPATYAGVGLMIAASVWNTWPRRATVEFCRVCEPEFGVSTPEQRKG
jgi:hypothetical protein